MFAPTPIGHEGCLLADVRWLQRPQRTSESSEGGYRDLTDDIATDSSQAEGESQDKAGKERSDFVHC
jgi:hypothetical protein